MSITYDDNNPRDDIIEPCPYRSITRAICCGYIPYCMKEGECIYKKPRSGKDDPISVCTKHIHINLE